MITDVLLWGAYVISLYFIIFWLLVFIDKGVKEEKPEKLTQFPFVSITVPAYNEEKTIRITIESLLNLNYPKDRYEIIVVNDGSTDNTRRIVEEIVSSNKIVILINQINKGKGAALNTSLRQAKGEFFICLDADSCIEKDALLTMLPYFEKDKELASVLPRICIRNPSNFITKMQWFEYVVTFFYKKLMSYIDCVHVTPGPFSIYRTNIIKQVGTFDENNLTEDLEMAFKLQKGNYKIKQVLNVKATTIAPSTLKGFYKQRNRWFKGALLNLYKYKDMIFNRKYGEFGLMQVPMVFVSAIISIVLLSIIIYGIIEPLPKLIFFIYLVKFDFLRHIKPFFLSSIIANLSFDSKFYVYTLIGLGILFVTLSFRSSKEKIFKYGITPFFTYIFVYHIFASIIWIGTIYDLIIKKKQKW